MVADSPTAGSWAARVSHFNESGLNSDQIQTVIHAANAFTKDVVALNRRASQIRHDVKSNLVARSVAAEEFKSIDQQRERVLANAFDQLRFELGRDGSYKLETFLNKYVKPTIRFVGTAK
jgi:hypothetical protein